jgi:hypothetical protein
MSGKKKRPTDPLTDLAIDVIDYLTENDKRTWTQFRSHNEGLRGQEASGRAAEKMFPDLDWEHDKEIERTGKRPDHYGKARRRG